jgi:DtxR family Mn-dependent transcriptional regulator
MEDYLEAIHELCGREGVARVRDIAGMVGVALSTVSCALRSLSAMKLVNYQPYETVTLTRRGRDIARRISGRHRVLRSFLREVLNVSEKTADEDACRLEHGVSRETVKRLVSFMEFLSLCPRTGEEWIKEFHYFCRYHEAGRECLACVNDCLRQLKRVGGKSRGENEVEVSMLSELRPGQRGR